MFPFSGQWENSWLVVFEVKERERERERERGKDGYTLLAQHSLGVTITTIQATHHQGN